MSTKEYILSANCRLLDFNIIPYRKWPQAAKSDPYWRSKFFILERDTKWFLIPLAIKSFLENFEQPVALDAAVANLARKANCKTSDIAAISETFLSAMLRRKIIRPNNAETTTINGANLYRATLRKGKVLGNYRIETKLFANRKTEIYKAFRRSDNRPVALKTLRLKKEVSPQTIQKSNQAFLQEFQLMRELGRHPHVCQFLEHGAVGDIHFGVMELIEGKPLRSYLTTQKILLEERLRLLTEFFSAMAHMHRKGIIHGDIHMSNILINSTGRVKLIDFNMSNRAALAKDEIIKEGGVYPYIPPEKVNSKVFHIVNGPANFCSELYQMGVVAYYTLYRKMPFDGFCWKELATAICSHPVQIGSKAVTGEPIPAYVLRLLNKLLQKDPQKRYKSAHHFYRRWKYHQKNAPQAEKIKFIL